MKSLQLFRLSMITFFLTACSTIYYPNYQADKGDDGKCFSTAKIPEGFITYNSTHAYPIFTGDNPNKDYVHLTKVIVKDRETTWEKKSKDGDCQSSDPNDCFVWCLVNIPEIIAEVYLVTDTKKTSDFEYQYPSVDRFEESKMATVEVLCPKRVDSTLVTKIVETLHHDLNIIEKDYTELDETFFAALREYQQRHELPAGALDIKTLKFMGVYRE